MKCPYTNDPVWKEIVAEHGELEAYAIYIENGYEIPTSIDKVKQMDSVEWNEARSEPAEGLREVTAARQKILSALITKYNLYEGSKNEDYVVSLKALIEEFQQADIAQSMTMFMENAITTMDALEKRMGASKNNLAALKTISDFAGTYGLISEVVGALQYAPEGKLGRLKDKAALIQGRVKGFNDNYLKYARATLSNRLGAESTIMHARRKVELQRQYEDNFHRDESSLSNAEYETAKASAVDKQLEEEHDKLLASEKRHMKEILRIGPKDISTFTSMMIDPRGVNDHSIQMAVKVLDTADRNAKELFIEDRNDVVDVWRDFTEGKKGSLITDQKKLYEGIIEKIDGSETNYYVRAMYSTFYDSRSDMLNAVKEAQKNDNKKEAQKILKEWREENLINPKKSFKDITNVIAKHHNPQMKSMSKDQKKMYDFLVEFNKESDEMVHGRSVLGYRLPAITKTTGERYTDKGLWTTTKEGISETFKLKADDVDFGELEDSDDGTIKVLTDQHGKALKRVSVPFRNKLAVSDQSFDLMGMALTNRFVTRNYQEKLLVKADMEVLKDLMEQRAVANRQGGKAVMRTIKDTLGISQQEATEITDTIDGDQSKSYALLNSILEDRLYGKAQIGTSAGLNKASNFLIKVSANNMLIANALGGAANVLAGKTMNFFESTRKIHYSRKNLRAAELKYGTDLGKVINDVGSIKPESKTNMLLEKFLDTSMDFSGMSNQLTQDTKLKNILGMHSLHALNASAEHYIQSTLMYAVLDNVKVKNKKGQFVGRDGKPVATRELAMGMDQVYKKDEKGNLKWGDDTLTIEGFPSFDKKAETTIARKMKDVTADLQGNYDASNKATIQRYWYGKLGFYLRKWMVRSTQRRWRGVETAGKEWEDLAEHEKFYSESAQQYKEGTYTSAVRFLWNARKNIKGMQTDMMRHDWNRLTDMEKANVRSAAIEVTVMVGSLVAANLLLGLAEGAKDEPEEQALYLMTYLMRRQYGELVLYTGVNPSEAARVLSTPTAAMGTFELATRTMTQLIGDAGNLITGGDADVYKSGEFKDDGKSWHMLNKLLNPYAKNVMYKDIKKSEAYLRSPMY